MSSRADSQSWILLLALSLVWGGSFLFIGIAVKELPPLVIVMARVAIAATVLLPTHLLLQGPLPRDAQSWIACGVMSVMNNVIPFTLIVWGQQYITAGLASVINATTPFFAVLSLALFQMERLTFLKVFGIGIGILGVIVLKGQNIGNLGPQTLGMVAVLLASVSYGFSSPWAKTKLKTIPPMTIATCQLMISTVIMFVLATMFSTPASLTSASPTAWIALLLLATVSTALAYLMFFRIIQRAGPAFVSLVTMVIPVSAILLGYAFLNEKLEWNEFAGAAIIIAALMVIDGRVLSVLKLRAAPEPRP